jgi:hypothetical protein
MTKIQSHNKPPKSDRILVSKLEFDPENPRFPPDIATGPIETLIERFVRDERLLEVATSIADQGYFEGEPLLVTKHGSKYHVIEGNRRLAALKLLNRQVEVPDGRLSIDEVVENANHRPDKVPCLIFEDGHEVLRYLGFRHITGIKSWSSLQKARYLKRLKETFYNDIEGKTLLTRLAREIGSRSDYVGQMLAALNVYEHAEHHDFYKVNGLNPEEIDFSVLATGLSYSNISEYVGLEGRQDMIGENVSDENLKNLLTWMFVARSNQKSILGESRNLRKLAAIVDSPDSINILIKEGNLDSAYQLSKGPAQALNLALKSIEKRLKDAWDWMPLIETPDPGDDDRADNIRKLATDLRNAIRAKHSESEDD